MADKSKIKQKFVCKRCKLKCNEIKKFFRGKYPLCSRCYYILKHPPIESMQWVEEIKVRK